MNQGKNAGLFLLMATMTPLLWAESSPTAPPATAAETNAPAAPVTSPTNTAAQPAPAVTNIQPKGSQEDQTLARVINDGSRIEWWGPDPNNYLVLWREQSRPKQHGVLVLLHSELHNADWPGVIHTLRIQLPTESWSTASLSMPKIGSAVLPPNKEKEMQKNELPKEVPVAPAKPENAMPTAATEPTATQTAAPVTPPPVAPEPVKPAPPMTGEERIGDALTHLSTQPGAKVLVVYHLAAEPLLRAARNGKLEGYSAIVLIEPAFLTQNADDLKQLNEELALLPFATLDISAALGDAKGARYRKDMATRSGRKDYVQWIAPGSSFEFPGTTDLLENRLRGWLHKEFELPRPKRR